MSLDATNVNVPKNTLLAGVGGGLSNVLSEDALLDDTKETVPKNSLQGGGSDVIPLTKDTPPNDNPSEPVSDINDKVLGMTDGVSGGLRRSKRNPTLTSKGREYQLSFSISLMTSCEKRIAKQVGIIDGLLSGSNVDLVNNEMNILEKSYGEFMESYARACKILADKGEDEEEEQYVAVSILMETVDSKYLGCKERVCNWLLGKEMLKPRPRSVHSESTKRTKSSRSSTSRCSDLSLRQKAKVAGLKAEAEVLRKTREAELSAELSRLDLKIKKAEAIEKVYASQNERDNSSQVNMSVHTSLQEQNNKKKDERKELKKKPRNEEPVSSTQPSPSADVNITSQMQIAMMDMMKLQSAPKPDLDTFSGDPLEYLYFKANFQEVVETAVTDQRGRLTRLIKYTKGDAKELIKHLVHAEPHNCYTRAISLLDKEYGNPHLISCSYIKELRLWKLVKDHDASAFKKLYRFLLKCQAYKREGRLQELDSTDMIKTVISKVHTSHQGRWVRKALDIRRNHEREANFSDLVKFMEREVEILSDPAYSRDALMDSNLLKANSTLCGSKVPIPCDAKVLFVKCPLCQTAHDIEDCEEFLQKDLDQRHKTVFREGLCFSCLCSVGEEHVAKSCTKKRKCRVCNGAHPTTLHGGKGTNSNHTSLENNVISQCVVPVQVWHKDNPGHKVAVYALLDDCSQGTFVTDDVLETLNVQGTWQTSINVTTLNGKRQDPATAVKNLIVQCFPHHSESYPSSEVKLPCTFSRPALAVDKEEIPIPTSIDEWEHLHVLKDKLMEYDPSLPIGLMIGGNCPQALAPLEVIEGVGKGPFAKRTRLGWCVVGPMGSTASNAADANVHCYSTRVAIPVKDISTGAIANHCFTSKECAQDNYITNTLKEMYAMEFNEIASEKRSLSHEDEMLLQIMEDGARKREEKHVLPLPFRNEEVTFPSNREQVRKRLIGLKRRLTKNKERHVAYSEMMRWLISSYAQKADTSKDKPGKVWYIPHHGVYNAQKQKLRVVFDGSAKFEGMSLNEELLTGPHMANLLVGVLARFRKEDVAIMADIEAMFYQVLVPESQRSFFRFFWWKDGNLDADLEEYEMCVHLFGAVSSGNCANYALKKTADEAEAHFGPEAAQTVRRDFYVDDWLKSVQDVPTAKALVESVRGVCATGGFNLTKFVSNSREVIDSVPSENRASSVVNLDLLSALPMERALGVQWCIEEDTLSFRIEMKDTPSLTRRSALGTISSIYDPHGLAGPFILLGRRILQKITQEGGSWDDELSPELRASWEKWRADLPALQNLKICRCYKPLNFKVVSSSLHSFSDASDYGYGQASYLRQVNEEGEVCVSLVMAKSRVVPSNPPTIPRLELTAALVSAKIAALLFDELDIDGLTGRFWVDSMIVLGYIQNDTKRFRTYVANRSKKIRDMTEKDVWSYVSTDDNPADDASRGISVHDSEKVHRWFHGPAFLKEMDDSSLATVLYVEVPDDDLEVCIQTKSNAVQVVENENGILSILSGRISNWMRMKRVLATVIAFTQSSRCKRPKGNPIAVEDVVAAEVLIVRMVQAKHFAEEVGALKKRRSIGKSSRVRMLDPFLDEDGVMRVGGRLRKTVLPEAAKHPAILPKKEVVVRRMIEWYHKEVQHLGRTTTLGEIRSQGYWLICGNEQVRQVVYNCVPCKVFRGQPVQQKMSDLPENRTVSAPPFTYCGVDLFGPFLVKEGRREVKRYGVVFTCFGC